MGDGLALLAVDDERPALDDLVRMLRGSRRVHEVRAVGSAEEALVELTGPASFDGLFVDVRMPGLGGIELARVLRRFERPPAVVFVSAFDDAAVDAFELAALDYLVKPVSRRRLDEAIERVLRTVAPPAPAAPAGIADDDVLLVDTLRGGTRVLARSSILYLQAHGDYVRVVADEGRFLLRARLAELEQRWSGCGFARVHRGYLVNLRRAVELRPHLNGTAALVMADGAEVPIARRQVGDLRRRLAL